MPNSRKILIVDDDTELRTALVEQLALHDEFEAAAVDSGTKGESAGTTGQIERVVKGVGPPALHGRADRRELTPFPTRAPPVLARGRRDGSRAPAPAASVRR